MMYKKLFLLALVVLAVSLVVPGTVFGAKTADIRIASALDDHEERVSTGVMDVGSSDLELAYETGGTPARDEQLVGLRFVNVPIAGGTLVSNAYVEFEVDSVSKTGSQAPVNLIIEGELTLNAAQFADSAFNISQRLPNTTTAKVKWSAPPATAVNEKIQTVDISSIIQEIVNQEGWVSGNALVLIIRDDKENPSTGLREVESFEGEAPAAALLHVEYGLDPFLQDGGPEGIVSMEAENFHDNVPSADHAWELVGPTAGFTGLAGMQALPNAGTNVNTGYVDGSPRLDFEVAFLGTGTHYVWILGWGASGSDDSCHVGLDGQAIDTSDRMQGWNNNYQWSNGTMDSAPATFEVTSSGVHVVSVYMREDGLIVDKIVLTKNPNYAPSGDGPPESPHGQLVKAYAPIPADGAIEVVDMTLEWTAPEAAVSHRVYLSLDETIDESDFLIDSQLTIAVVNLAPATTYYWRVDEVEADGTTTEGDVWSFTTMPLEAHFPNPPDGAIDVLGAALSWTAGKGAILHNVYFGTDPAALPPVSMMQMGTSYDPGALAEETTYYWRVDEFTPAGTVAGPVWSFSTVPVIAPTDIADLIAWYPLQQEATSYTVLDMSGNRRHGVIRGNLTFVNDADRGQVLSLPGGSNQFVEIGPVGISGNMPRTIACWAKADHTNIPNWTLIFGFTTVGGGNGSHFNIGSLGGPGGVGAHVWGWEETIFSDEEALEWHHYAMSYDGTTIRYYGDGVPMDTDEAKSNVRDLSIQGDNVHIGSRATQDSSFPGSVSDARIYSRVLTDEEVGVLATPPLKVYVYDGDADVAGPANDNDSLDGTWDHNNGSDSWDGSKIGEGSPGGASALVEDGVTFLRIQDTGDPRDYSMPDPSNRKVYFTHVTDVGLDGTRLDFRARIATTAPLDDLHPDGGAGVAPWPAEGIGYHIRDNGKGMVGIAETGLGIISFSLAQAGEPGFEAVATDVLVMNNLVADTPSGNVDTGDAATAANMIAIADATAWNTFVIDIVAGGAGTHVVSVSVNGQPAQSFDVTVGSGVEAGSSYITMGSSGTGAVTAFDVDYISVSGN